MDFPGSKTTFAAPIASFVAFFKDENPEEILDLIRIDLAEKLGVLSEQITDRFLIEIYEKIKGDTDNSILEVVNPGLSQALNFKDLLKKETNESIRAKMSKFFRK